MKYRKKEWVKEFCSFMFNTKVCEKFMEKKKKKEEEKNSSVYAVSKKAVI